MYGFRNKQNKLKNDVFTDINVPQTAVNELANKPRYDIDGRRYGNTLSDDMFAVKNPGYTGHTPRSYEYLGDQIEPSVNNTWTPAVGWNEAMKIPELKKEVSPVYQSVGANPFLQYGAEDFRTTAPRREKVIDEGESLPWEVYKEWGLMDDILEFPEHYTQDQLKWAENKRAEKEAKNRIASLGTDDLRAEKLGTYEDPTDWVSRRDAELDRYLDEYVNYGALSPATLTQLAKMGVNRPVENDINMVADDDASEYLNFLINVYRRNMGL